MKSKPRKSAGQSRKAASGNVTVDLGEKHNARIERMINSKLASVGMAGEPREGVKTQMGRPFSSFRTGLRRPGGALGKFRPGVLGSGRRLWSSRFRRPWMGQSAYAVPSNGGRTWQIIPRSIANVKTADVLSGVGLGILGNRALLRLTPALWSNTRLVHEGIAFVAGLIPLIFKRNPMTLGVAIPGAVILGSSLVDSLFNMIGFNPSLSGAGRSGTDSTIAARQKLAALQQRINVPAPGRGPLPQVVARPL